MQTLMDRLDALIKVTRERASEGRGINEFDRLYHALRNMGSDKEAIEMGRKWNELHKEISLNKWDEQFLKAVAGEENNPDNLFYSSTDHYTHTQLHQEQLTKNELVKAFLEMQKQKQLAELELERDKMRLEHANSNA